MKIINAIPLSLILTISTPATATIYDVLGGTFSINSLIMNVSSTGGILNINEGASSYQGFGSILNPFMFSGFDVNVQTAASVGAQIGGDAPSGNVVDGGTVDMSSFFAIWNSNEIYQGNSMASVEAIPAGFKLAWSADNSGPKLSLGQWTIDIAEQVPVPVAGVLMTSGLLVLAGFFTRKDKGPLVNI